MAKKLLIIVAVVVGLFVAIVATRPSEFHIERKVSISAPREVVFATINDFHRWGEWSPWAKMDPNQKITFSGAESGVGAAYAWVGEKTGEGSMSISSTKAPESVEIKLDFLKPMEASNVVKFTLVGTPTGTDVTWGMDGHNNFMGKMFSIIMNMDQTVGGQFAQGLESMKSVAEGDTAKVIAAAKAKAEADARAAAEAAAAAEVAAQAADAGK